MRMFNSRKSSLLPANPKARPRFSRSPDALRGNGLSERIYQEFSLLQSFKWVWGIHLPLLLHHSQPLMDTFLPLISVLSPFSKIHTAS